jgi:hypothetical protein
MRSVERGRRGGRERPRGRPTFPKENGVPPPWVEITRPRSAVEVEPQVRSSAPGWKGSTAMSVVLTTVVADVPHAALNNVVTEVYIEDDEGFDGARNEFGKRRVG